LVIHSGEALIFQGANLNVFIHKIIGSDIITLTPYFEHCVSKMAANLCKLQ